MTRQLPEPSNYTDGVGQTAGEPSNILFLRRDPQQRINSGSTFSRLRHDRYVLTVNLQTEGLVCIDGQTYHLPVNHASLVQPYQLHYYMVDQTEFTWLVITFDMAPQDFARNLPSDCVPLTDFQYIRLCRMLQLYHEILSGEPKHELLLQRMLGNFLRELALSDAHSAARRTQEETPKNVQEFERINKYIFSRLDDASFTVNDITRELDISTSKLYSIFRVMSECNPGDYIRAQRIRRAMRMLQNSGDSVTEIARKNGFSSLSIFSRAFKKVVGQPPSNFATKNVR